MKNTRRKFITTCIGLFSGSLLINSCSSGEVKEEKQKEEFTGDPCENMTGIGEDELAKRKQLGYVEKTPLPENHCNNCQLYIPAKTDKDCGGCMLFKGPVHEDAYCTYWAPQV